MRNFSKQEPAGAEVQKALTAAVSKSPEDTAFLKLVRSKTSVDADGGQALCVAVEHTLQEHVELLLEMKPNATTLENAFLKAQALHHQEYQILYCRMLLEAGVQPESINKTLVKAISARRTGLMSLLLQYGASADFNRGSPISAAVETEDAKILELLLANCAQKPTPKCTAAGFDTALNMGNWASMQAILELLLVAGVPHGILDDTLVKKSMQRGV